MYPGIEACKQNVANVAANVVGASKNMPNQIKPPRDISPIEQAIQRHMSLISDLGMVAHDLTDSIGSVMRYDPRQSPQAESAGKSTSPGCAMESQLEAMSDSLAEKIRLLRSVRETICL